MNITLSADKELIEKVRDYAAQHGTSLNQIIREHLEEIACVKSIDEYAQEFERLARDRGGTSPDGYVFDRNEAHVRKDEKK